MIFFDELAADLSRSSFESRSPGDEVAFRKTLYAAAISLLRDIARKLSRSNPKFSNRVGGAGSDFALQPAFDIAGIRVHLLVKRCISLVSSRRAF
jgi:hypothetical protein